MPSPPPIPADNLDFAWDRPETAATLRAKLAATTSPDWLPTAAWLMREARVEQVWEFLTLQEVARSLFRTQPYAGSPSTRLGTPYSRRS